MWEIRLSRYCVVFVLWISVVLNLYSQHASRIHEQYRFNYITVDDGLSNNRVRGLVQDKYGFIWISTRNGIDMFDGHSVKSYNFYYIDSLEYPFTETLMSLYDSRGTVWVSGDYGVCYYCPVEDCFGKLVDPVYPERIISTLGIAEDHDSILWFTTASELLSYNPKSKKFQYLVHNPEDPGSLPEGNPQRLLVDHDNNLWIGYGNEGGVALFDKKKNLFTHYTSGNDSTSLAENYVERIYMDDNGTIWFGHNNNGISKLNRDTKTFTRYMPDPGIRESGRVRGLLKDPHGNFWVGTQAGLYLFDEENEKFFRYAYDKHPISVLSHNSIQLITLDNQEGLWLGTFAGGVSYTNLNTSGFIRYDYSPLESPYYLNDKMVYSLAVDKLGNVWAGTENGGLNYLNRKTGKFTYYVHDPNNPNSPGSNNIKEIIVTEDNNIWFCAYNGGFSYLDTQTGQFTNYTKSEDNPTGFPERNIYCMIFDPLQPDLLWLGTINGLYLFNINTREYARVSKDLPGYINPPESTNQIRTFQNYNNEKLFIGGSSLITLDLASKEFKSNTIIEGIHISTINFIHVDKKDFVWFDINNNYLVRMDIANSSYQVFGTNEGLPNLSMFEAQDDNQGNLWISSNLGIYQFAGLVNNQDTLIYNSYDKSDNLQSLEFQYHSKAVSPDGEVFFGGINGFNSFYPQNVITNPYPPEVHITNLKVANKSVEVGEKIYGKVMLHNPIIKTKEIKVHHRIKVFTLEFAGLHFVAPENNNFKYILEGYDDHWITTDASVRFATYSNLPAGTYYFKVNAANNNGLWTEEPAVLKIKVIPPFWKTSWFLLLVILIVVALIIAFIRWRESQLKKDKEILETKLKEGEDELNIRKVEMEKQKEELEEKERLEQVQKWHNKGLIVISDILRENKSDINQLSQNLVKNIVQYIEAELGGIFLLNDEDKDNTFLELTGNYAFNNELLKKNKFLIGEGQVGACFKSKEIMQLDNIPDTYTKLKSGLGESKLTHLLFMPVIQDETIVGVIELASFSQLEDYKIDFLKNIAESIVSVITTIKANDLIKKVLENSQSKTQQLQSQEEEMRQNLEEMQATQEEAQRREKKLESKYVSEIKELKKEADKKDKIIKDLKSKK